MKPFRLKFLCTACLAGALWLSPRHDGSDALAASAQQKAAQEKKRVEGQRANIEQKLQSLQAELDAREARSEEASQALKTADQAISQANRKLRDLREEKRGVEDELAKLRKSGNNVADNLKDAENTVALGRGQVTEDHLRGVLFRRAPPDVKYCLRALNRLALRVGGQHGIDEPLV